MNRQRACCAFPLMVLLLLGILLIAMMPRIRDWVAACDSEIVSYRPLDMSSLTQRMAGKSTKSVSDLVESTALSDWSVSPDGRYAHRRFDYEESRGIISVLMEVIGHIESFSRVSVTVYIMDDAESARDLYEAWCGLGEASMPDVYKRPDAFIRGVEDGVAYCVTYLRGDQEDTLSWRCLPSTYHWASVMLHHDNSVWRFDETTTRPRANRIQEVVNQVAASMRGQ